MEIPLKIRSRRRQTAFRIWLIETHVVVKAACPGTIKFNILNKQVFGHFQIHPPTTKIAEGQLYIPFYFQHISDLIASIIFQCTSSILESLRTFQLLFQHFLFIQNRMVIYYRVSTTKPLQGNKMVQNYSFYTYLFPKIIS